MSTTNICEVLCVNASYSREGYLTEDYHYFHLKDTAGQERDFHFHDFDKLVILLSGRVDYMVERATYALRPWDILLIGHHTIHKALIDKSVPYERVILYLDRNYPAHAGSGTDLSECFEGADRLGRHLLTPSPGDIGVIGGVLEALDRAALDEGFGAQALRDTLVTQLLIAVNRVFLTGGGDAGETPPQYDPKIDQTLSYINENLSKPLTVEALAERVYLSKYHFMRLFKAQTGSTVHAYVRQRRLLYAAQLIRQGENVNKAAADSGFEEYSTFFRAFRECFGVSPGQLK